MNPQPVFKLYELDSDLSRAEVVAELAAVPDRLASATGSASADALTADAADGGWSAFNIVCHMRDAAIVYSGRFRWMVFDDNPPLANYNEDRWVADARDTVADLPAIVDEIRASRSDLVRVLSRLPEDAWLRTGRHEVIGVVTLEPYVRHQLAHELSHLAQLRSVLGA